MSRRDKVLAFLAEQDGGSFDGSVSDLADDMSDPSPAALSATISVLVKDGLVGREPEGVGVVATRLWLCSMAEPRDVSRAEAEPEVQRCPHGVPLEAAAKLCTTCKAADRQRKSRATRRAADTGTPEPDAPQELAAPEPHVCGPECTGSPTHLAEPREPGTVDPDLDTPLDEVRERAAAIAAAEEEQVAAERAADEAGPSEVPHCAGLAANPHPRTAMVLSGDRWLCMAPGCGMSDPERVLCAPACEEACRDGCDLAEHDEEPASRVVQEGRRRPQRVQMPLRMDLAERVRAEADARVVGAGLIMDRAVEAFLEQLPPLPPQLWRR